MTTLMPIPLPPLTSCPPPFLPPPLIQPRPGHSQPPPLNTLVGLPTPGPTPEKLLVHPLVGTPVTSSANQQKAQTAPQPQHLRTGSAASDTAKSDELMQSGSGSALGLSFNSGSGGVAVNESEAPLPADAVDFPGPYNFEVSIPPQAKNTKSISWTVCRTFYYVFMSFFTSAFYI